MPGSVVGVLGSGQLGRMFAIAARQLGYRVHTYSPDSDTPTGQVSDKEWQAPYEDLDKVRAFAAEVRVVTFEFENIPAATAEAVAGIVPVRPGPAVLHVTQHRLREKNFLASKGFPVAPFAHVKTAAEAREAVKKIGTPCVLKSAGFGYDGKGQKKVTTVDEAEAAFTAVASAESVVEAFVDFEREISVVAARGADKSFVHYGAVENSHTNHILDVTVSPASVPPALAAKAVELARGILEALDVVGVMAVEMFVKRDGTLLVNELAPRPHNSGHFTIDACDTSQFEQQLRAICGLPLGATTQPRPAAMANLLGDVWEGGEPRWAEALKLPGVRLHLYGKAHPRRGRKMGHLTAVAPTSEEARQLVVAARDALRPRR
jgi:5-(carboxyamino)imidazole ribonucleotide synthase